MECWNNLWGELPLEIRAYIGAEENTKPPLIVNVDWGEASKANSKKERSWVKEWLKKGMDYCQKVIQGGEKEVSGEPERRNWGVNI